MLRRLPYALALAPVLALAMTAPAHAAGCPLLADPAGDERALGTVAASAGDLDLVSADLASGASTVVAVLRVRSLAPSVAGGLGTRWLLAWNIGSTEYAALVSQAAGHGAYTSAFLVDGQDAGPVQMVIDPAAGSFTWTIPRSYLPDLAAPGRQVFDTVRAISSVAGGTSDTMFDPSATYDDRAPGCVPAA